MTRAILKDHKIMSVGILIITHTDVGDALLKTAIKLVGSCPIKTETVNIPYDCNIEELRDKANNSLNALGSCDGVLVLTDIYGSTPSNIAKQLDSTTRKHIISGINLPMLVRIFNYPELELDELADKAISASRDGVTLYKSDKTNDKT
jgi:PTS system mannose-specific IIA component